MVPGVICLGDDWPITERFRGWNSILGIFAPDFPFRPCLYFDLDTYVLGDISEFHEVPKELMLIRDFNKPRRGNSGVMQLPENTDHIWNRVKETPDSYPAGNALNNCAHGYLQDKYPGKIVSYKVDKCTQRPQAPIMCFHGKPKPHQCEGWAKEFWTQKTS